MRKKTLVLGASLKPHKYSNFAIRRLVNKNHEVVAVGLREGEVGHVKIETGKPYLEKVDTVTLYINQKRQIEYYEYIISLNPKRVIFNPGSENMEFVEMLRLNNIETEISCTLVLLTTNQY